MSRRTAATAAFVLLALAAPGIANAHTLRPARGTSVDLVARVHFEERSLAHYKGSVRSWTQTVEPSIQQAYRQSLEPLVLDSDLEVVPASTRALAYAIAPELKLLPRCRATNTVLPRRVCAHARLARVTARALARDRRELALRYLPLTRDWLTAVRIVQRAFPYSNGWLIDCSSSEGGHGPWVPNSKGSGAGGWMQYMAGTFAHDFNRALADVAARGFIVPSGANSWYSALGQALAGGWAYGHDRPAGKWTGASC